MPEQITHAMEEQITKVMDSVLEMAVAMSIELAVAALSKDPDMSLQDFKAVLEVKLEECRGEP